MTLRTIISPVVNFSNVAMVTDVGDALAHRTQHLHLLLGPSTDRCRERRAWTTNVGRMSPFMPTVDLETLLLSLLYPFLVQR